MGVRRLMIVASLMTPSPPSSSGDAPGGLVHHGIVARAEGQGKGGVVAWSAVTKDSSPQFLLQALDLFLWLSLQ